MPLENKVKEGDKVVFQVRTPEGSTHFRDWGYDSEEEMTPVHEHDGQTATVTGIAIDDGDPASAVIDGPYYVDIKFDDGFELHGIDGYNLTPVENAEPPLNVHDHPPVGPGFTSPREAPPSARFTKAGRRPAREDFMPYQVDDEIVFGEDCPVEVFQTEAEAHAGRGTPTTVKAGEEGTVTDVSGEYVQVQFGDGSVAVGVPMTVIHKKQSTEPVVSRTSTINRYLKPGNKSGDNPVAHDFIPAMGPESIIKQATQLVNTVLEHTRRLSEKTLTTAARKKLSKGTFVFPKDRRYPIPDKSHARNALARVSQHGTSAEKARVRAAVHRKFPTIGKKED
jgi:hypothetical protein